MWKYPEFIFRYPGICIVYPGTAILFENTWICSYAEGLPCNRFPDEISNILETRSNAMSKNYHRLKILIGRRICLSITG